MDFGLTGQQVVVVGGHRGIGLEIARGFQDQGSHVTITSEDAGVFAAKEELNARGGPAVAALQFDLLSREEVSAAIATLDRIDVLVINAGVFWETPSAERSAQNYDTFARQLMINVVGTWWCAMEAAPRMPAGGRIMFTASISGRLGSPNHAGYAGSKHAILGVVRSMAKDLGPQGISVNAVCPGSSATDMNLASLPLVRQRLAVANMVLRPGLLDPADHVGSYLFLASAAGANITGQTITIDRGQTCI